MVLAIDTIASITASLIVSLLLALFVFPLATPARADPSDFGDAMGSDADVVAARAAYDRKDWQQAIASFLKAEARFPDSPELHNSLGYAYRNLGQFDRAFRHYEKAIALDPRHRAAHEYIGEAYLMVGDLASAEKHLAALREICLLPCEELQDLEREVRAYKGRAAPR
jgi:tetratricopeptide (TPR) repeat protein